MMRGGGIAALWLLLFVCVACEGEEHLFVNGARVNVTLSVEDPGDELYASLVGLAPRVGIELSLSADGAVELRWTGDRLRVLASDLKTRNGEILVAVDWLLGLVGGTARRFGETVHVETEPASVTAFAAAADDVVVRFDRFAPMELIEAGADVILVRFHHVRSGTPVRSIVFAEGPLSRAELRANGLGGVDLVLSLREIGALRVSTFEADPFYSTTLGIQNEPERESVCVLGEGIRLVEIEQTLTDGSTSIIYIHMDDWRARARIEPALPSVGASPLKQDAQREFVVCLERSQELLVIDGAPCALTDRPAQALSIDAFGRLDAAQIRAVPFLRLEAETISLDGFNRPLVYDELVAYAPGYTGELAPGVPGRFTVLKIRSGRVVSAFDGAFIDRDETATMIIGSGEAGRCLSRAAIGDDAKVICLPVSEDSSIQTGAEPLSDVLTIDAVLLENGVAVESEVADAISGANPSAWAVLAVDVLGGVTLMTVAQDERSAGATRDELLSLLHGLPARVIDAFVLSQGSSGSLWVQSLGDYMFGRATQIAVELVVRSIDE